jgi:hypothetical protein
MCLRGSYFRLYLPWTLCLDQGSAVIQYYCKKRWLYYWYENAKPIRPNARLFNCQVLLSNDRRVSKLLTKNEKKKKKKKTYPQKMFLHIESIEKRKQHMQKCTYNHIRSWIGEGTVEVIPFSIKLICLFIIHTYVQYKKIHVWSRYGTHCSVFDFLVHLDTLCLSNRIDETSSIYLNVEMKASAKDLFFSCWRMNSITKEYEKSISSVKDMGILDGEIDGRY